MDDLRRGEGKLIFSGEACGRFYEGAAAWFSVFSHDKHVLLWVGGSEIEYFSRT